MKPFGTQPSISVESNFVADDQGDCEQQLLHAVKKSILCGKKAKFENDAAQSAMNFDRDTELRSGSHFLTHDYCMMLPTCSTWPREQASYAWKQRKLYFCRLPACLRQTCVHPCLAIPACVNVHLQACNLEADRASASTYHVWCTCQNAQHSRCALKIRLTHDLLIH
jgi:hypothetical protein